MAITITIVDNRGNPVKNTAVRAWYTGGFGKQEGTTDHKGEVDFTPNANRTQISVHNGHRWEDIGGVLSSLTSDKTIRWV